jgi:hypothetical protein
MHTNKKRIFTASVMVLVIFSYFRISQNETRAQEPSVAPDAVPGQAVNPAGAEILALLTEMKSIRLDEGLFSDPTFQSLQDTSVELNPEPKGRPNPFAPLGKDVVLSEDFSGFATTSSRSVPFGQ